MATSENLVRLSEVKVEPIIKKLQIVASAMSSVKVILSDPVLLEAIGKIDITSMDIDVLANRIVTEVIRPFNIGYSTKYVSSLLSELILRPTLWEGRNRILEKDNEMHIEKGKDFVVISNFTLEPITAVVVDKGNKYHNYKVNIKNDPKSYTITLKAEDFNTLDSLQKQVALQLNNTSAYVNKCSANMSDLAYKYLDLAEFGETKQGTSLIGLERFDNNGKKYFCTPNGIYDVETGEKSEDIVYMGNEQSNIDEIRKLTNLEYNSKKWQKIAKEFLSHVIGLNDKSQMMKLLGWIGAIPHDYVIRKVANVGGYPHMQLIAEPGSGKTTLLTLIKQFVGHNDSAPRAFPTPFETRKLLNSSYSIPVILDEYGKRWSDFKTQEIDSTLVESYNKSDWSRGQSNLQSVYFKYKNPVLFAGQIPATDQALQQRTIPIEITKAYQNTPAGINSKKSLLSLQNLKDKNFWVGYCMWAANHENTDVAQVYHHYNQKLQEVIKGDRNIAIYSVVAMGLHYMKKLSEELKVDIGYTYEEITTKLHINTIIDVEEDGYNELLVRFLQDIASYGIAYGNVRNGKFFGKGLAVSIREEQTNIEKPSKYGKQGLASCVVGQPLLLVKIKDACTFLKQVGIGNYKEEELKTFLNNAFQYSQLDPNNVENLVLAPAQCRIQNVNYTVFNLRKVISLIPEFVNVKFDDTSHVKYLQELLV